MLLFSYFSSGSDMWHHRNYAIYYCGSYHQPMNKLCGSLYFFLQQSILKFALFIQSNRTFREQFIFGSSSSNLLDTIPCCFFYICSVMSNLCIVQHKNLRKNHLPVDRDTQLYQMHFYSFSIFFGMVWKSKLQSIDEDFKCGRHHLQFVPTTYVVTLFSFFFYQRLVQNLCSNLQVATNMHQTMWQLLVLFSPHQQKLYYGQLIFFAPFLFQGVRRKGLAKPTDLGEPGLKTIIKDQC